MPAPAPPSRPFSNAELARRLTEIAQALRAKGENPFKVRAYRRAADTVAGLDVSLDALVRAGRDVTVFPGIGRGIAAALREIVFSGKLGQLELLLPTLPPGLAALNDHPRLDPQRVARIYGKLKITTVTELRERLAAGEIGRVMGTRLEEHVRQGLDDTHRILLYDADALAGRIRRFLKSHCRASRTEVAGSVRRRVEVVSEIAVLVSCRDFADTCARFLRFGGGIDLIERSARRATFQLPGSVAVALHRATAGEWGGALLEATGAPAHLAELENVAGPRIRRRRASVRSSDEITAYAARGLPWIPPELREGQGEVQLARAGRLPDLVTAEEIRGELHAHTTASDGSQSMEEMAAAAKARGYEYLGITDHSQSLKIARGVAVGDLWTQIRRIDRLNRKLTGIRLLKSAEVDILADGTLDYPDDLLAELDYTICSIHSRFRLGRTEQTERVMRAMDHPSFTILGHATGRLLLKRPGYELDLERIIAHARDTGRFFEINASPDRLDLSAENVRLVTGAGIRIAICTDAHHLRELDYLRCGIDVARRGGVPRDMVLNTRSWPALRRLLAKR